MIEDVKVTTGTSLKVDQALEEKVERAALEEIVSKNTSDKKITENYLFKSKTIITASLMLLGLVALATAFCPKINNKAEKPFKNVKDVKHSECKWERANSPNVDIDTVGLFWKNCDEALSPESEHSESQKSKTGFNDLIQVYKNAEKAAKINKFVEIINGVRKETSFEESMNNGVRSVHRHVHFDLTGSGKGYKSTEIIDGIPKVTNLDENFYHDFERVKVTRSKI